MFSGFFSIQDQKITKHLFLCFFIVFLINFLLKLIHLDVASLWYDEVISIKSAQEDFGHIKHVSEWDKNPPFYYYCLWVWIKLFGNSVFTVRLLSVVFSSLAAGVLFAFANKFINYKTALFASAFFMSNNLLFFYAHEARAYSLVVLLALLSAHVFFSAVTSKKPFLFILLGLLNFLLVYSHYISGLVWFFEGIAILAWYRPQLKWFSISTAIMAFLVFLRFTSKQFHVIFGFNGEGQAFWLQTSGMHYLKEMTTDFFSNHWLLALLMAAVFVFAVIYLSTRSNLMNKAVLWFSLMMGAGSIALLFLLGKVTPVFLDRYILFSIPFLYILPAYLLSSIKYKIVPVICVMVYTAISLIHIDFDTPKSMDYKNAMKVVKAAKDSSTAIIVSTTDIAPLFAYYYDRSGIFNKNGYPALKKEDVFFANNGNELPANLSKYSKIIFVSSFREYTDGSIEKFLDENTQRYNTTEAYRGVMIKEYHRVKLR